MEDNDNDGAIDRKYLLGGARIGFNAQLGITKEDQSLYKNLREKIIQYKINFGDLKTI